MKTKRTENQPQPEVGMGVTMGVCGDAYPYTVTKVIDQRTIEVQADHHTPAEGFDYYANQVCTYAPNPNGTTHILTKRTDGAWREEGVTKAEEGGHWYIGFRLWKQDPHV